MGIDLHTFLGSKVATSVKVNGVYVPANSLASFLQAYSEPALFHNPDFPEYELTRRGTIMKGRYRNRYFALVTAHQSADFRYEQLVIHEKSRANASSSGGCTFSTSKEGDESELDCRLYDFTEPVIRGALPTTGWLEFQDSWLSEDPSKADYTLLIGFPTELNDIDHEKRHFATQPFSADGAPTRSSIKKRHSIRFHHALTVDPDGLSGSPVYGFFVESSGIRLALLGITTNASRHVANYLPLSDIRRFLKRAFYDNQTPMSDHPIL